MEETEESFKLERPPACENLGICALLTTGTRGPTCLKGSTLHKESYFGMAGKGRLLYAILLHQRWVVPWLMCSGCVPVLHELDDGWHKCKQKFISPK